MSTSATRVVLAEDEVLMREGLAGLLDRSGFEVVGQCGNASELIDLVRELRPDLVIVDIRMPPTHTTEGLEPPPRPSSSCAGSSKGWLSSTMRQRICTRSAAGQGAAGTESRRSRIEAEVDL